MTTQFNLAVQAARIALAEHPRPSHVTQGQACEMLDVSRTTLTKWIVQKKIRRNKCGMIPITEIDRLLADE